MTTARTLRRLLLGAATLVATVPACHTADVPTEFGDSVAPVLQRHCAASQCHGVPPGGTSVRLFQFPTDANSYLSEDSMVEAAYAAARRYIDTTEIPELSSLLRKPLPMELGGLTHAGGPAYRDSQDPAFVAVRTWISHEHGGAEDGHPESLTDGERFFRANVQPLLARSACMESPCHGTAAASPMRFDVGFEGTFGVVATRANYAAAQAHLSLGGWPELSRLLLKVMPGPGVGPFLPSRGGHDIAAFPRTLDDPLPRAVIDWARLERRLRTNATATTEHELAGIVFVGGPVGAARVVEHDGFTPGSDLYLLAPATPGSTPRNLTAALHASPVDIRNPVVDAAGAHVAFSMRTAATGGAELWELDLASGAARQVTRAVALPDGHASSDISPAYAPDGRIWFSSNRAGMLAEHADGFDTDLYVLARGAGPDAAPTRRTFTPMPELTPSFLRTGNETKGSVAFTAIRRVGEGYKGVVFRFPPDLHLEYHPHFGVTGGVDITYHMRELPDGTLAAVLLDRDAVWSAGALAIVDRNLGPELSNARAAASSLPRYLHPISYLGPYGSHDESYIDPYGPDALNPAFRRTTSEGAYRDPAPLPDGRVAVAWADGTVALTDRTRAPDFGLYALTLDRDPGTGEVVVASRTRLVDLPGVSETEPVPVYVDVPGAGGAADPHGDYGRLSLGGAVMIENVLHQVGAVGPRVLRTDIAGVRALLWLGATRDAPIDTPVPGLYAEQRRSGATPHLPALVVAEAPLERDGTIYLEIPAGASFRVQFLDARGMVVGTQYNRWFDIFGGQDMHIGVTPETFDFVCNLCHGARSGRSTEAFGTVDMTARPSLSLARMVNDDPARPRAPIRLGASTIQAAEWRTDVLPLLQRSCATAGCHDAGAHAAALDLSGRPTAHYDTAYESLVARGDGSAHGFRYVDVVGTTARGSHVIERILGEELDAPRAVTNPTPHRGQPALSDAELHTLLRWIETGALYCAGACP